MERVCNALVEVESWRGTEGYVTVKVTENVGGYEAACT